MNEHSESLLVHFRRVENLRREALDLPSLSLSPRQLCDLELLLSRACYPLCGYLNRADYDSVLERMTLTNGTVWPIPIALDVKEEFAASLKSGQRLALTDDEGFLLAILTVGDIWRADREAEAKSVYGTDDASLHPGVAQLYNRIKEFRIGGALEGVTLPIHYDFRALRLSPSETVRTFTMNGWRRVLGFHTDEYLHCAHREMVLSAAREAQAAIFLQPVADLSHPGDLGYYTQIRCYEAFAEKFPRNMIALGITPYARRFAGPKEALWQAIIRKNFGCSHFMVAEDQADPFRRNQDGKLFYERGAAQQLVAENAAKTGIEMVRQRPMGYNEKRRMYLFMDELQDDEVKQITSTELERRLEMGEHVPEWFSWPEIVRELQSSFPPRSRQGFTIFMTGLSGSGKSTIAKVLMVQFLERNDRPVTLLDGDIVRRNLSSELNFTKEHRNLNVTRIGFVASEITKNGGIAICAPIAPYPESRAENRELISGYGGYIEVYVSTPLEVCEGRDRKGLYAKGRAGIIKGVTGIDDPYFPPENPELTLDTTEMTPMEAVQEIMLYLEEQSYLQ
ncbi:MAG: bifunctional sulfate adenylyltransferase/adenylylsulfate kinase [Desulforhopalus sp.]|nr:bifunctional sulfate adenylyltransferase/adenylylsulfate kinase [Desulforhopalus sp.]